MARVRISNPGNQIAFFIQAALTQGNGGAEILPVLWSDNYLSLLPGETRELRARFSLENAGGKQPALEVGGWNIECKCDCSNLKATPAEAKIGEPVTITGSVRNTFLDGSRVVLRFDGKAVASPWAWARGSASQDVTFSIRPERPGRHTVEVGNRSLIVPVKP